MERVRGASVFGLLAVLASGCGSETTLQQVSADGFFEPASLAFGTRSLDRDHQLSTILSNGSGTQLRVAGVRYEPPLDVFGATLREGGTLTGLVLNRNESAEVVVTYSPLSEADHATTMVVEFQDIEVALPITARAVTEAPARPGLSPDRVRFEGIEVGRRATQPIRVVNVGDTDGALESVTAAPPFSVTEPGGAPLSLPSRVLEPGHALDLEVQFEPATADPTRSQVRFGFDSGESARLFVDGDPLPAGVLTCEAYVLDFGVVPRGGSVERRVSCSASGGPWSLKTVRFAVGSSERFALTGPPPQMVNGRLEFDVVFDSSGLPDRYEGALEIVAEHSEVVRVSVVAETSPPVPGTSDLAAELIWNTADNDLDLHLVRPGAAPFDAEGDCFFENKSPDWGTPGYPGDDPFLDRDVVDGFGPEALNLAVASETHYDLYVQYYGFGPGEVPPTSAARVTLFIRDQPDVVRSRIMGTCGETWYVGRIRFDVDPPRFEPVDQVEDTWSGLAGASCRP